MFISINSYKLKYYSNSHISVLTVNYNMNIYIYTLDSNLNNLQSWSLRTDKLISLFEGKFQNNPIGYKLQVTNKNSIRINVITANRTGSSFDQWNNYYTELYINTVGNICIINRNKYRVIKRVVNANSWIVIAGDRGYRFGSSSQFRSATDFAVDEI